MVSVPAKNSRVPLEHKFGITGQKAQRLLVKTRQVADELGITFHVGSQTTTPDAYAMAFEEVKKHIVKAGVVDPKKVTRTALQNAASIAGLLLTTECLITEIPEKDKKAPAPGGHGGGMGEMDY